MRSLTTIGYVGETMRATRQAERYARLLPLRTMGWIGATNPAFVVPSATQLADSPPGQELAAATVAMLQHFATDGVPSMHTNDPLVLAFQRAYNLDDIAAATGSPLGEDGGYGNNSHDVAAALAAKTPELSVPPVNTSSSLVLPTVNVTGNAPAHVTPAPSHLPATPTKPTSSTHALLWVLGIGAALGLGWWGYKQMKKRRPARRRARAVVASRAIVLA